ncbi:hypothetical protein JNW90_10655 [Micromonospora sp. STR1s_5]|nr:hypothetical protein [Micromonospora sp. STR1s_5]
MPYIERDRVLLGPWEDVTGDRERDGLICALHAVERRLGERRGWDQPVRLWTLHLADIDNDAVEVRPVPAQAWQRGAPNPVDDMVMTAGQMPVPPIELPAMKYADAPDGIAGVALMTEGWAMPTDLLTEEERAARAQGQRVIANNTNRVEIRTIVAVDINGHGYTLTRMRGQEPLPVELTDPAVMHAPPQQGPGRVARSLFGMAWAARTTGWPR